MTARGAFIALRRDADVPATLAAIRQLAGVQGITVLLEDGPLPSVKVGDPVPQETLVVGDIIMAVCQHYRMRPQDLTSDDRHTSYAHARHVAMYLCKLYLPARSYPELGGTFNRDHTSVMYGVAKVKALLAKDGSTVRTILLRNELAAIQSLLPERVA